MVRVIMPITTSIGIHNGNKAMRAVVNTGGSNATAGGQPGDNQSVDTHFGQSG